MANKLVCIAQRAACVYSTRVTHNNGCSAKQVQHLSSFVFSLYRLAHSSSDATLRTTHRCWGTSSSHALSPRSTTAVLRGTARWCAVQLHERLRDTPRGHVFPVDVLLSLTRILQYGSNHNSGHDSEGGDIFDETLTRAKSTLSGEGSCTARAESASCGGVRPVSAVLSVDRQLLSTILTILDTRLDVPTLMQWSPSWLLQLLHGVALSFPCHELHPFTYTAEASADAKAMGTTAHRPPLLVYDIGLCLQSSPPRRSACRHHEGVVCERVGATGTGLSIKEGAMKSSSLLGNRDRSNIKNSNSSRMLSGLCREVDHVPRTGTAVDQLNATQCAMLLWSMVTLRLDSALPLLWTLTCRRCRELFMDMTSSSQALVTRALITLPECVNEAHAQLLSVMCSHARSLQSASSYEDSEDGGEESEGLWSLASSSSSSSLFSYDGAGAPLSAASLPLRAASAQTSQSEFPHHLLSELWVTRGDAYAGVRRCVVSM